ncbi:MAG TPA: hypothetical protein VJA16_23625, partial [Thermoanaerobaculia bacterium]
MSLRNSVVYMLFAWSLTLAAVARGQTGAPAAGGPVAATDQAAEGEELEFSKAPLTDAPNDPGSAFVARAIADRSWSVTLGSSSTLDGYTFPATLQVLPFLWSSTSIANADQAVGLERLLLQSSVAVKYVPLVVRRTPGTKTGTDTSSDRKGSITYSLPLLGTARVQRYHDFIHAALETATKTAHREGRQV